jgi:uncharacterized LabA/DUF88 family protein
LDKKSDNIYAFIDSQNLNLSIQNDLIDKKSKKIIYKGWKLDFRRFYIYLRDKYKVSESFLFIGRVNGKEDLYEYLEKSGYKLIFKPTLVFNDEDNEKRIKGNVDAELVLHTMIEMPNFGKAIIVAGDGDYHCLIEYLASQNKLLHIFIPNRYSYSSLLRRFSDYFVFVSDLRTKLGMK